MKIKQKSSNFKLFAGNEKVRFFNYFDYSQTKFYVYWQSGIEHHGQKKHGHTSLTYAATVYLYSVAEWIITFRSTT